MSANTQQKALFLESKQGKLVVRDTDIIPPAHGQLLIQEYGIYLEKFPAILGTDAAGDVVEVGPGVTNIAKGDKVFFQGMFTNEAATFQQYTLANALTVSKIPPNISYDEAASIPVALTAAYVGLYHKVPHGIGLTPPVEESGRGKYSGKPLVVIGGSSSVGQYAIQLAKLSGFWPIITTCSPKHAEHVKSLGATHVIDRTIPLASLRSEIAKITRAPIGYAFDAISSSATQNATYDLLASGGHLAIVLDSIIQGEDNTKVVARVLGILSLPHNRELLEGMVEVLPGGLGGIVNGLEKLKNDQVSGVKLIARPQER
ncbi:GroES-like protein [Infundibulicybe gibba]|nr:GroES-like protein [Infundibulicybe gibba]